MNSKTKYIADALPDRIWSIQDWGSLGLNTAVKPDDREAPELRIGDKKYTRGLGSHANGRMYIDLAGEYETFEVEVGVLPQGSDNGSVIFRIIVDGKEVFCSDVMRGGQASKKVKVSVEGAVELLLIATDAGDGIGFDVANWADARLTINPSAPRAVLMPPGSVDSLARVFIADPAKKAAFKRLSKQADGIGYLVPLKPDGTAWVGMAWDEIRFLRRVTIQFADAADMPKPTSVKLQGEGWNGWKDLPAKCYINRDTMTWLIDPKCEESQSGVGQIRWQFPAAKKPIEIKGFYAYDHSSFKSKVAELRFEAVDPKTAMVVPVEIYNGNLLDVKDGESTRERNWDMRKPLKIKVNYSTSGIVRQRTVIRFGMPNAEFGVAVEDVMDNDCVYVPHAGVFITRTPQPVTLKEHLAKVAASKTVLDRVYEMPDQTFAQAMKKIHNPIQNQCPTMLSLACDNNKFTILDDGSILDRVKVQFGDGKSRRESSRWLQGEWRPIPVMTVKQGGAVYRQRTCVAPFDEKAPVRSPDWFRKRAICVTEYIVKNHGQSEAEACVALSFPSDPKAPIKIEAVKEGFVVASSEDKIFAFIETTEAGGLDAKTQAETVTLTGNLSVDTTATFYVYIPTWPIDSKDYATLAGGEKWFDRTVAYWDKLIAPAMQVKIPDELLENIIIASQVHCMLAARNEDDGRLVAAWISSDRYGALDTESQAVIRGMDMVGQLDFSRRSLNYWLSKYNPQGFFFNYSIAGVGENLWTIAEHYDRTQDRDWLKKSAPIILRACKWIQGERRKSMTGDADQKPAHWGLTPPGTSADWQVRAYRFYNEAQFCAGLAEAGRLLADISHPDAQSIIEDAESYRQDIIRAYRWNQARSPVQPMPDGTWLRYYPSMLYYFGPIEDYFPGGDMGRTFCYDVEVGAHHLAVNGILDPAENDVTDMINHMEDVQFMRAGWGDYPRGKVEKDFFNLGGFGRVQPYYCRNAELYALRDDVKPFIRAYFNALATSVSTENLSLWEHFRNGGAWNKTHETGWFLCQTRIMFVQERGDELWLAPFVTNNWLKDGMKIAVRNAPTRFGDVSYEIQSSVAKGYITATITPPDRPELKNIVIRLRHPDGLKIKSVTVNGKEHKNFDAEKNCVSIPAAKEPITVRADYR